MNIRTERIFVGEQQSLNKVVRIVTPSRRVVMWFIYISCLECYYPVFIFCWNIFAFHLYFPVSTHRKSLHLDTEIFLHWAPIHSYPWQCHDVTCHPQHHPVRRVELQHRQGLVPLPVLQWHPVVLHGELQGVISMLTNVPLQVHSHSSLFIALVLPAPS